MSIFSETMAKAISDYKLLLRRYLPQAERMAKLRQLKLRNIDIHENDLFFYEAGQAIVADLQENLANAKQGYYSYSGIQQFCDYLKTYLDHYHIDRNQVVHRTQKASRALVSAIQLTALPKDRLDEKVAAQLFDCNKAVACFGSAEQYELQMQLLVRQQTNNPGFYARVITHLESLGLSDKSSVAA